MTLFLTMVDLGPQFTVSKRCTYNHRTRSDILTLIIVDHAWFGLQCHDHWETFF